MISRRSFLKLFGGGVASLAVPTKTYSFLGRIQRPRNFHVGPYSVLSLVRGYDRCTKPLTLDSMIINKDGSADLFNVQGDLSCFLIEQGPKVKDPGITIDLPGSFLGDVTVKSTLTIRTQKPPIPYSLECHDLTNAGEINFREVGGTTEFVGVWSHTPIVKP